MCPSLLLGSITESLKRFGSELDAFLIVVKMFSPAFKVSVNLCKVSLSEQIDSRLQTYEEATRSYKQEKRRSI